MAAKVVMQVGQKVVHLRGKGNMGGVALVYQTHGEGDQVKVQWSVCSGSDNYSRDIGRRLAVESTRSMIVTPADPTKVHSVAEAFFSELNKQYVQKRTPDQVVPPFGNEMRLVMNSITASLIGAHGEDKLINLISIYQHPLTNSYVPKK